MGEGGLTVRLFAGARAAADGIAEVGVAVAPDATLADALARVVSEHPGLGPVLPACSFLLDGVRAIPATRLARAATLDVLPPFSGG